MDLRSAASVAEALGDLPAEFEGIDILFNNAGLALGLAKAPEADLEDWEAMIEINITGLARVTRSVLPGMVARNRGDVLNMASGAGQSSDLELGRTSVTGNNAERGADDVGRDWLGLRTVIGVRAERRAPGARALRIRIHR